MSQIRDSTQPGGPDTRIYIPQEHRVAKLYPHALGFIFVASYDSQSFGGVMYLRYAVLLFVQTDWYNAHCVKMRF
jgi:hypothetical protein